MRKPSEFSVDNDSNTVQLESLKNWDYNVPRIQNIIKYKHMKQLFLKYKTPISSSIAVEDRLASLDWFCASEEVA